MCNDVGEVDYRVWGHQIGKRSRILSSDILYPCKTSSAGRGMIKTRRGHTHHRAKFKLGAPCMSSQSFLLCNDELSFDNNVTWIYINFPNTDCLGLR